VAGGAGSALAFAGAALAGTGSPGAVYTLSNAGVWKRRARVYALG